MSCGESIFDKEKHSIMLAPLCRCLFVVSLALVTVTITGSSGRAEEQAGGLRFSPTISYAPDTGLGYGAVARYFYPQGHNGAVSGSILGVGVLYSRENQYSWDLRWDSIWIRPSLYTTVDIPSGRYRERFFGIGNDTYSAEGEDYTLTSIELKLAVSKLLSRGFSYGTGYRIGGYDIGDTTEGGLLEGSGVTGTGRGVYAGPDIFFTLDRRDSFSYPTGGEVVNVDLATYVRAVGSDFNFGSCSAEVRKYFSPTYLHVLAVRARVRLTFGEVPFTMQSVIGGQGLLQAYERGRYRDRNMFVLQSEYRMPVLWRFGVTLAAGVGDVFRDVRDLSMEDLKYSLGTGVRLRLDNRGRAHLRLDYATGRDSSGFYIGLFESY